jgi:hypothetical protein
MFPVRIEVRTASRLPDLASILSRKAESLTEQQQEVVESAAEMLYGLIHARFILTARGMQAMVRREAAYSRTEGGMGLQVLPHCEIVTAHLFTPAFFFACYLVSGSAKSSCTRTSAAARVCTARCRCVKSDTTLYTARTTQNRMVD